MPDLKVITSQSGDDPALSIYYSRPGATALVKDRRGVDIAEKTWANWAWEGRGPRWTRFGRRSVAKGRDILAAIDAILDADTPPHAA